MFVGAVSGLYWSVLNSREEGFSVVFIGSFSFLARGFRLRET